ncbi:MAG: transcription antiterminator BlgG [Gemmobacter sp.]|jgi:sulfate adenylyltransferase|nr:transcription antiterminator BlgG [Gemmobacter sp.]
MLPHQTPVRELFVSVDAAEALLRDAAGLTTWDLTPRQIAGLDLMLHGGLAPLRGFMTEADHDGVIRDMRLPHGMFWPLPVTLDVPESFAVLVEPGQDIALRDGAGAILALLSVTDRWRPGAAETVWQGDPAGPIRLGGPVAGLRAPDLPMRQTPNTLRSLLRQQGIERVVAITTGQDIPPHLAGAPGITLLVQPMDGHAGLPPNAIPLPLVPEVAGTRGRLWQALVLRNHGATHLLPSPDDPPELVRLYAETGLTLLERTRIEDFRRGQ